MKNHKINPRNIVDLVNLSTTAFSVWKDIIVKMTNNPKQSAEYMHFVSDVLDDLIKATYPLEDKSKGPFTGGFSTKSHVGTMQAPKSPCNHKIKEPIAPKVITDDIEGFAKELKKALDGLELHTKSPERPTGEFRPKVSDIVTLKDGEKGNYMGSIAGTEEHRMWLENGLVRGFRTEDVSSLQEVKKSK
ncbi:MAG TPA: hypothetical protein GX707_20915 [Epulopiscium sp.]|nr:hypothetical protein [Candidatus Epulonipiscium sp.]